MAPVTPYLPLFPDQPVFAASVELMEAIDDELNFTPELSGADAFEPITLPCNRGGSVTYEPTEEGVDLYLDGCSFNEYLTVSGRGSWDTVEQMTYLRVSFEGERCLVTYEEHWYERPPSLEEWCLD